MLSLLEVGCLSICFFVVHASLDLYLSADEVFKLFGIKGELYYIHDGEVNHNALSFVARVQPEHNVLKYKWHSRSTGGYAPYDIESIITSDSSHQDLLKPINISISNHGSVPTVVETFEVYVHCTGTKTGNITFETKLTLRIPAQQNTEKFTISITRLKKCEKVQSIQETKSQPPGQSDNDHVPDTTQALVPSGGMQQSTAAFYIAIAVVIAIIISIFFIFCWWHVRMNRRHKELGPDALHPMHLNRHHGNQFLRLDLPNNVQRQPSHSSMVPFTPFINDLGTDINEIRGKLSDISISRDGVSLGELLIKGTFARIYKGTLQDGTSVLIKTVTEEATDEQKRLLLLESSLLKGMQNRNLLCLKHVVLENDGSPVPMAIFPFKEGGNLKHFLQSLKLHETSATTSGFCSSNLAQLDQISTQELVEMGIQVAFGMTFLSKRGLVHKDLASRNCVIDGDMKIKITDYALSRDAFPRDYCCLGDSENRPVRWLAFESLVHKVYSSASDVWSFGVFLWELQSLAAIPYSDVDDFEMEDYLSDGIRLSQPVNCPDVLYSIMAGCWHYAPDQRPSFPQLLNVLTDFYAELGDYV